MFSAGFLVEPRTCDSVVQSVVLMMAAGNVRGKEGESRLEHLEKRRVENRRALLIPNWEKTLLQH